MAFCPIGQIWVIVFLGYLGGLGGNLPLSSLIECNCGVRYLAHQYLHDVYLHYKKDSLKEGVRNAVWETLEKFRDKEKNPLVLCINKSEEKVSYYVCLFV